MKFNFTVDEMGVLLTSLLTRRNTILQLMDTNPSYAQNLKDLESVMEKLFPGSVEVIFKTEKVS
jgi:hypothetical protein